MSKVKRRDKKKKSNSLQRNHLQPGCMKSTLEVVYIKSYFVKSLSRCIVPCFSQNQEVAHSSGNSKDAVTPGNQQHQEREVYSTERERDEKEKNYINFEMECYNNFCDYLQHLCMQLISSCARQNDVNVRAWQEN